MQYVLTKSAETAYVGGTKVLRPCGYKVDLEEFNQIQKDSRLLFTREELYSIENPKTTIYKKPTPPPIFTWGDIVLEEEEITEVEVAVADIPQEAETVIPKSKKRKPNSTKK